MLSHAATGTVQHVPPGLATASIVLAMKAPGELYSHAGQLQIRY